MLVGESEFADGTLLLGRGGDDVISVSLGKTVDGGAGADTVTLRIADVPLDAPALGFWIDHMETHEAGGETPFRTDTHILTDAEDTISLSFANSFDDAGGALYLLNALRDVDDEKHMYHLLVWSSEELDDPAVSLGTELSAQTDPQDMQTALTHATTRRVLATLHMPAAFDPSVQIESDMPIFVLGEPIALV